MVVAPASVTFFASCSLWSWYWYDNKNCFASGLKNVQKTWTFWQVVQLYLTSNEQMLILYAIEQSQVYLLGQQRSTLCWHNILHLASGNYLWRARQPDGFGLQPFQWHCIVKCAVCRHLDSDQDLEYFIIFGWYISSLMVYSWRLFGWWRGGRDSSEIGRINMRGVVKLSLLIVDEESMSCFWGCCFSLRLYFYCFFLYVRCFGSWWGWWWKSMTYWSYHSDLLVGMLRGTGGP